MRWQLVAQVARRAVARLGHLLAQDGKLLPQAVDLLLLPVEVRFNWSSRSSL